MRRVQKKMNYYLLNLGHSPEEARQTLLMYHNGLYVSHWTGSDWKGLCSCDKTEYKNKRCIHITEVACKNARVAYCYDTYLQSWSKHPIGACPHGSYRNVK